MWNIIIGTLVLAAIPFLFAAYGGHLATESIPTEKRRKVKLHFWILFFVGLALAFFQQYRAESIQRESEQKLEIAQKKNDAAQKQMQANLEYLVQRGQTPIPSITTPPINRLHNNSSLRTHPEKSFEKSADPSQTLTSVQRPVDPISAEIDRRKQILATLRNEYILSHDNISAALLAGTEYPPTQWVNERLETLKEKWRFNETKDEMILHADKMANSLDTCADELEKFHMYIDFGLEMLYPEYRECVRIDLDAIILKTDMLKSLASSCSINPEPESHEERLYASGFVLGRPFPPKVRDYMELQNFTEIVAAELRSVTSKLQTGKCPHPG